MRLLTTVSVSLGLLLLVAGPGWAQQGVPAADSAARPSVSQPAGVAQAATDVIVRTNGDELPGRVLAILPGYIRYLPAAPSAAGIAPDTLQLATAEVFLIRYANGTKEVFRPAETAAAASPLLGLSTEQRYERGRQDSRQYYQPAKGVFWGTFAGTVATGGYGGPIVGGVMALTPPRRTNLQAPAPTLLDDPAYYQGYRRQAQNRKIGKAAAGFGVGVGALAALGVVISLRLSTSL